MSNSLNQIAEQYVKLILRVGLHDPYLIDAYYGPPEWRPSQAGPGDSVEALRAEGGELSTAIEAAPAGTDPLEELRREYLRANIRATVTKIRMVSGERLSFDEESRGLYGAVSPAAVHSELEEAVALIESAVPGSGALGERLEEFKKPLIVPAERVEAAFQLAVDECRARTKKRVALPADESFQIEFVRGQPWSAYNWFKGSSRSLIQVNIDLPLHLDRVVHLAAHEGYPGHHVHHSSLEEALLKKRGWIEFAVNPLYSPLSLIAEGIANTAKGIVFPGDECLAFERDVLAPAAGINPAPLAALQPIRKALGKLKYAGNEAARGCLEGTMSTAQAEEWLCRYCLMSKERAAQRIRFFERYRSYVITYNVGEDLVRTHLRKVCGEDRSPERRWQAFADLLSRPAVSSTL